MKMKKIIALVLVLSMLMSTATTIQAAASPLDSFVDGVMALTNKTQFVDLVMTFRSVSDPVGLANTYTNAFSVIAGFGPERSASFGVAVNLLKELALQSNNFYVTRDELVDWIGLDGTQNRAAFYEFARNFEASMNSASSIGDISEGLKNFDKLFDFFALAKAMSLTKLLKVDAPYGKMEVDTAKAESVYSALASNPMVQITDKSSFMTGIGMLPLYYNALNATDKVTVYDYLNKNGFIIPPTDVPLPPVFPPVTPGSGGTGTGEVVEEEIGDNGIPSSIPTFADLGGYSWARLQILKLAQYNVILGKGNGLYAPSGLVTRAEFAAMLTRLFDLTGDPNSIHFTDVKSTDWYADEIAAVFAAGIVNGRTSTTFAPKANITRGEMAIMIGRAMVKLGKMDFLQDSQFEAELSKFSDRGDIPTGNLNYITLVINKGIINGAPLNSKLYFKPNSMATRAESALMLYKVAQQVETIVKFE